MERNEEIVAGLDIGTTKIACIVGRKNEQGKLEIMGMGKSRSDGVSRGVVTNIQRTVDSIKAAVQEAEDSSGVEISTVNVGIAGQHIRSMHHRGMITRKALEEEIRQQDIDQLIDDMYKLAMEPGEEIIHVLPQEYIVDNEQGIKDPIGMSGVRLEANFHIITGQVAAARNINKCVSRANLDVTELILEPLASADAVLCNEEKEAGVALVDIGGGTTDIAIFNDHIIRHTAVIPFGGNVITDDIKMGCAILRDQAELLKNRFGSALASENKENEVVCIPGLRGRDPKEISLKNLANIIQCRMEEIIEHVYFQIKSSGLEKQLSGGIVLTGGGSQLKHLRQLTEYITGMSTRIGYPSEHLAQSKVEDVTSPLYATGVGLVLRGFDYLERHRNKAIENTSKVKTHSQPSKVGGFFEQVLKGATDMFRDDEA
ncbi:MAG: cell division protein FtsA [Flavobacteriales bacterium]|nr:cell division protein FtsA [Flavobacteriales bacterium]MEB2342174.1 cell division protein FtsA [Flavobacteriia bacterium]